MVDQRFVTRIDTQAETRELKAYSQAVRGVGTATHKAGEEAQQATRKEEARADKLRRFKEQLERLTREELQHERAVNRGEKQTEEAARAARSRQRRIERLSRALREEERVQERVNRSIRDADRDVQKTGRAVDKLGGSFRNLTGLLAGAGGTAAALAQVRRELDAIFRMQEEAASAQTTVASAQRSLKLNLAGESEQTVQSTIESAGRIAQERGVPEAQVTEALAGAISATGGNIPLATQLTDFAAQVRPDQPSQLPMIAGALGDIGTAIGSDDPEQMLGFLLEVGRRSRLQEFRKQARNIPRALIGATEFGFEPGAAGAFFSALTKAAGDTEGELTGTAAIQFSKQLQEFFVDRGGETGMDAVRRLQREPELRAEFLANFSAEAKAIGPLRSLLREPEGDFAQMVREFRGSFGGVETQRALGRQTLRSLSSGELAKTAGVERTLNVLSEQLSLADIQGGRAGAIRDQLADIFRKTGRSDLAARVERLRFEAGTGLGEEESLAQLIGQLGQLQERLLNPVKSVGGGTMGGRPALIRPDPTEEQRTNAAILGQSIEQLRSIAGQGGDVQVNVIGQQYNREDPARAKPERREVAR